MKICFTVTSTLVAIQDDNDKRSFNVISLLVLGLLYRVLQESVVPRLFRSCLDTSELVPGRSFHNQLPRLRASHLAPLHSLQYPKYILPILGSTHLQLPVHIQYLDASVESGFERI